MKRHSSEYTPGVKIRWCMDNNIHNYRNRGLPAPAEPEVLGILDLEISRLRALYMQEYGVEFNDASDDKQRASTWIESQPTSDAVYAALKDLEKIYDIHQIVSILVAVTPSHGIRLKVVSVKHKLVVQLIRQS